jgi:hypothetical protein
MNFRSFLDQDQRRVFATRTSDCLPSFETTTSATELILQIRVLPDYGLVFQGIASNTKPNLHLVQILAALHGWRLAFAPKFAILGMLLRGRNSKCVFGRQTARPISMDIYRD